MHGVRLGAPLAAIVALVCCLLSPLPARAASVVDVGDGAVVRVSIGPGVADLVVQSWDRNAVQVEAADDSSVDLAKNHAEWGTEKNPLTPTVPAATAQQLGDVVVPPGTTPSTTLGAEEFPLANFRAGVHDVVVVRAPGAQHVVVTVPSSTGVLQLNGGGVISVSGYKGANLFVRMGGGRLQMENVATSAFLEDFRNGQVLVGDSMFPRLRVRTGLANIVLARTHVKQIEATSVVGWLVLDDTSFEPGLARLETERGSIALGVAGSAQLTASAAAGRLATVFERKPTREAHNTDAGTAVIGNGGPLVTVNAPHGGVLLYDGTLQTRRDVPAEWQGLHRAFLQTRAPRPGAAHAAAPPGSAASAAAGIRREMHMPRPKRNEFAGRLRAEAPTARTSVALRRRA